MVLRNFLRSLNFGDFLRRVGNINKQIRNVGEIIANPSRSVGNISRNIVMKLTGYKPLARGLGGFLERTTKPILSPIQPIGEGIKEASNVVDTGIDYLNDYIDT